MQTAEINFSDLKEYIGNCSIKVAAQTPISSKKQAYVTVTKKALLADLELNEVKTVEAGIFAGTCFIIQCNF